jgi:hypothetical protein
MVVNRPIIGRLIEHYKKTSGKLGGGKLTGGSLSHNQSYCHCPICVIDQNGLSLFNKDVNVVRLSTEDQVVHQLHHHHHQQRMIVAMLNLIIVV